MTIQPKYEQFTANGNVRTADLLKSIAKELRRILDEDCGGEHGAQRRLTMILRLHRMVAGLAETIERS